MSTLYAPLYFDLQCELLAPYVHSVDAIYAAFLRCSRRIPCIIAFCIHVAGTSYKVTVPTFGCALIDPTRSSVLLVKGFGRNR